MLSSVRPLRLSRQSVFATTPSACRVEFGCPVTQLSTDRSQTVLQVALPVLAGATAESLLEGVNATRCFDGFTVSEAGDKLAGLAVAPAGLDLEAAAAALYESLFALTRGRHLYRIWNYVPHINAVAHDHENYRLFCRGRSLAFERHFGAGFKQFLPAASAVGTRAGPLALAFLAGESKPRHFENPRQVPAFDYPPRYGPRPPSFARATVVPGTDKNTVFISGTAAIIGHESVATGDLENQLGCTLENLGLISAHAGAGDSLGEASGWRRRFKVYLRHASDLARTISHLTRGLLQDGDTVQYLQADICRQDLLVEIEAVLSTPAVN